MKFSATELRDLGAAWVALGVAFTFFAIASIPDISVLRDGAALLSTGLFARILVISMATAGVGFLLHELAHKVVAIRFGQVAEFRADYSMLALAIGAGLVGFIFAAPGAVYHGGRSITRRQNGLIALAGPVTNLLIAAVSIPLFLFGGPLIGQIGQVGLWINMLLAGFNMLPFGPLDGRKVREWSLLVYVPMAVVCIGGGLIAVFGIGPGFRG